MGEVLQTELRPVPGAEPVDGEKRAARKIQELVLYLETIQLEEDLEPVE